MPEATATFLGPLTTSFTAPTICDTASIYKSWGLQQGPSSTYDGCLPSKWASNGYYSPGICPSGYTNACSDTQNDIETTICCPTEQAYSCASSLISDRFACSLYFSSTTTFYNAIDILSTNDIRNNPTYVAQHSSIVAYSVQVRNAVQSNSTHEATQDAHIDINSVHEEMQSVRKESHGGHEEIESVHEEMQSFREELQATREAKQDNNNNNNNNGPPTEPAPSTFSISFTSTSSFLTPTKSQSLSSPLSTQSSSVAPSAPAQVSTLARSTIAGIVGGIIGALLLGVVGTFVFMRRSKLRKISRSSQLLSEKSTAEDEPNTRASMGVLHELDEQRDPSEMPSWDEQNPGGPNKPPAWEMQGSSKFAIWELPA